MRAKKAQNNSLITHPKTAKTTEHEKKVVENTENICHELTTIVADLVRMNKYGAEWTLITHQLTDQFDFKWENISKSMRKMISLHSHQMPNRKNS